MYYQQKQTKRKANFYFPYIFWYVGRICKRELLSIHIVELYGSKIQLRLEYGKQLNDIGTWLEDTRGDTCVLLWTDMDSSVVRLRITCGTNSKCQHSE